MRRDVGVSDSDPSSPAPPPQSEVAFRERSLRSAGPFRPRFAGGALHVTVWSRRLGRATRAAFFDLVGLEPVARVDRGQPREVRMHRVVGCTASSFLAIADDGMRGDRSSSGVAVLAPRCRWRFAHGATRGASPRARWRSWGAANAQRNATSPKLTFTSEHHTLRPSRSATLSGVGRRTTSCASTYGFDGRRMSRESARPLAYEPPIEP